MSKKHSMTIKERLENRKESLYERIFDWIWDHTAALFKFLWGIIKELFIGTSMAIDKHDAKVASGQIKPHNYLRHFCDSVEELHTKMTTITIDTITGINKELSIFKNDKLTIME